MSVAEIFAAGVVLVPIAYVGLLVLGKLGVGPLASEARSDTDNRDSTAGVPRSMSLEPGETVEYGIDPKRGRWKYHAALGVFMLPFGWGIPILIYSFRVRKRPQYVVTNRRIIEASPDHLASYDYEDISQIQAGAGVLESLLNRGNVQFSVDNRQLITLSWMRNPEHLAGLIDEHTA